MYDVPDPPFRLSAPVQFDDKRLAEEGLRLTDAKIGEEYSTLRLTFSRVVELTADLDIEQVKLSLERLGVPFQAQRVETVNASAKSVDVSIVVECLVGSGGEQKTELSLPQNVNYRIVARQITVPYDYVMMWARLYLYQDGRVPDDDDDILSRAGSELTKQLPWWERWRPAFLGEKAIWQSKDGTVHFDYRLGDHYYAVSQPDSDGMKIIDPNLALRPILFDEE